MLVLTSAAAAVPLGGGSSGITSLAGLADSFVPFLRVAGLDPPILPYLVKSDRDQMLTMLFHLNEIT